MSDSHKVFIRTADKTTTEFCGGIDKADAVEASHEARESYPGCRVWIEEMASDDKARSHVFGQGRNGKGQRHLSQPNLDAMTNYNPNGKDDARSLRRALSRHLSFSS